MSDRPTRIYGFFMLFRSLFTWLGQTNPRYFQAFLHRQIGPRYLSIPKILFCTAGIAVIAPAVRAFAPVVTFVPLYLLPFAPRPLFPYYQDGQFHVGASEFWPFWFLGLAFLTTAIRRHLDGERRIIDGEELHSFNQGTPRFFGAGESRVFKEPLLIFGLGALWSYAALFSGAFHPAFGSFLMVGGLDWAICDALIDRYWAVKIQDQLDDELYATHFQRRRDEALGKRAKSGRPPGFEEEDPAEFHRANPGGRR